jgi:protein phosphatase
MCIRDRYYVGPNSDTIGIFRGVPEPVFNLPLSTLVQSDTTKIVDLPPYYQEQVRKTLPASSLDAARTTLVMLQTKAAECIRQRQQWHNPPTTTPTATPAKTPSGSKAPSPGASSAAPVPTPSETPTGSTEC